MKERKEDLQKKKPRYDIWFCALSLLLFLLTLLFTPDTASKAAITAVGIFQKLIPILVLVWLLMALISYFLPAKKMKNRINKTKGGWAIAVGGGILSSGPIYAWYPMLAELRSHGVRKGFIAAFLYNRAIKVPLLPVAFTYFEPIFILSLLVVMICASLAQGILLEWLLPDAHTQG